MRRTGKYSNPGEAVKKNLKPVDCSMVVKGTISPGEQVYPIENNLPRFRIIRIINCGEVPISCSIAVKHDKIPQETSKLDPGLKFTVKNTDDSNPDLVLENIDNERHGYYTLLITI